MTLYGKRQTGRTTVLINCIKKDPKGILAVHTINEKRRLQAENTDIINKIFTYQELQLKPGDRFTEIRFIYLDNADFCNLNNFKYPVILEVKEQ
jgi:hypothetical protein